MKRAVRLIITLMLGLAGVIQLDAQITSWQWVNPLPQGNDLKGVQMIDSMTVIAVGPGGTVIKSTDGGMHWDVRSHVGGVDPYLGDVVFLNRDVGFIIGVDHSNQGIILRTTDGGLTWMRSDLQEIGQAIAFTDSNNATIVGAFGSILSTTDGGITWIEEQSGTTNGLTSVSFFGPDTGYAVGSYGTILHTTNGGMDWNPESSGTSSYLWSVNFVSATTGVIVGDDGVILRTTDGGETWSPQPSGVSSRLYKIFFADQNHGTAVGGGTLADGGIILHTTDGGISWFPQSSSTFHELYAVSFSDQYHGAIVGASGRILQTKDDGETWITQSMGTTEWLFGLSFLDALTGIAVGDFGTVIRTTNGGRSWPQVGNFYGLHAVKLISPAVGIAVGDGGEIALTTDIGETWTLQVSNTSQQLLGLFFSDSLVGTAVGANGTILRTTDQGKNWSLQTSNVLNTLRGVYFINNDTGVVVGDSGATLWTSDGGASWISKASGSVSPLYGVYLRDAGYGTVVGGYGTILYTSDGGSNWMNQLNGTDDELHGVYFLDAETGIVAGREMWFTTNHGLNWSTLHTPTSTIMFSLQVVRSGQSWLSFAAGIGGNIICAAVSPLNEKKWNGSIDSSWDTADNWTPSGVPTPGDSVIIPAAMTNPVIVDKQQQITVASLNIASGGNLSITDALARFVVKGDVTIKGTLEIRPPAATSIVVGGSWFIQPGGLGKSQTTIGDVGFLPAKSTVYLAGSGVFSHSFYNLIFDTSSAMTSNGNVTVQNQCSILHDVTLRNTDTLYLQDTNPQALIGTGILLHGTIVRNIEGGSVERYRFESESTYVRFHNSAPYPVSVAMVSHPDSNLALNGALWDVVPGKLDTIANTIFVDSVTHFSKWAIGIVRPGSGMENPAATDTIILRFYDIAADVDSGFLAQLSLRYEQSELPAGSTENSIRLFRSEIVVGVQEENPRLPASFALEQNYPNPFNPVTVIKYQLPDVERSGTSLYDVSLIVYNVLGQQVAELVNETQSAGYQSATFDAGNLASGVYFYKIDANGVFDTRKSFNDVKKMVVMR